MQASSPPFKNQFFRKASQVATLAWVCVTAAVLASYAYLGFYSRFISDDFQTAGYIRSKGFWYSQQYWYQHWTGRFTFVFTMNVLQKLFGTHVVPLLPLITLVVWIIVLAWLARQLSALFGERQAAGISFVFAAIVVVVLLSINIGLSDVLYWETGIVTYTLPIILFLSLTAWLLHTEKFPQQPSLTVALVVGLVAIYIGGFSETISTFQTAFFGIALLCSLLKLYPATPRTRHLLVAGFVGSIVALVILIAAPGNKVRMDDLKVVRYGLIWVFKSAFLYAFYLIYRFIFQSPGTAAITFVLPAMIALQATSALPANETVIHRINVHRSVRLLLVNIVVLVLMAACIVPAFYAASGGGPGRSLLLPQLIMVVAAVCWGWLLGQALGNAGKFFRVSSAVFLPSAALLLLAVPLKSLEGNLKALPVAARYAREWDLQDQEIRKSMKAGQYDIKVNVGHDGVNGDCRLTTDSQDWYNQAVAEYYGLRSISAPDSTPDSCD